MPVLLACAIEDSTDIFGISRGGVDTPNPPRYANAAGASRGHRQRWPSRRNLSRSAPISRALFSYTHWGFPWFSFSCKANARIYDAKFGHGPHSVDPSASASTKRLEIVAYPEFATEPVCAQNTDSQPNKPKFIPPTISPGPPMRYSLARSPKTLSLTCKSLA